ncbi:hypothetical protein C8R46DRAFT_1045466 [Mycena filopes]|nr:hypothetical protein C8R46DRAFT_1045466 [Mycena filopes]
MATTSNPNTTFTPDQEMEMLLSKLSALSRLFPASFGPKSTPSFDARKAPARVFYRSAAPTPHAMDALHPPGPNDDVPHYVVCIGRAPGLYLSWQAAADQVNGVPDYLRVKKDSRKEALAYYREQAALGMTRTVSEVEPASAAAPVARTAAASGSQGPRRSYASFGGVEVSVCIT